MKVLKKAQEWAAQQVTCQGSAQSCGAVLEVEFSDLKRIHHDAGPAEGCRTRGIVLGERRRTVEQRGHVALQEQIMTWRHHISAHMRQHLEEKREELIAAVPLNMVDGLRHMLSVALGRGLSHEAACDSVLEALRSQQAKLRPTEKAWLVLEAGCMWIGRERKA